ncbi:unnamed protein product [Rotaria magnacalcarata]|uniref:Uncharacterized protein n=1 Tax=Rotaria magnacalcarata TaxID=392030 RepID=A0A815P0I6_9BILA|nr:unnamed protein product [Rotaria magnacalcarata]
MNICAIFILWFLIVCAHANFNIVRQIPNGTVSTTTNQFILEISQAVNQPPFPAFIYFNNATTNTSIYQISAQTGGNVTYSNNTLAFNLSVAMKFYISDEFYITFDAGVLFSNGTLNSTSITNSSFWYLKVIGIQTSTSSPTSQYTSMQTTSQTMTDSSMAYSATSTFIMTTMISTYTSMNQTAANLNVTTTTSGKIPGESPPTRSAQLGMGLGITFISILLIIELFTGRYHMEVLLAAGVVGIAGYALGKRRQRNQIANGYITLHNNGSETSQQYGNLHYGNTGHYHRSPANYQQRHHHHQTVYHATTMIP